MRNKEDPRMDDILTDAAADAVNVASPDSLEPIMKAAQLSPSQASRWRKHGAGPVGSLTRFVWNLAGDANTTPTAIGVHFKSVAERRFMELSPDELVERLFFANYEIIHHRCSLKKSWITAGMPGADYDEQLERIRRDALALAAEAEAMTILCSVMKRRRINPWSRDEYKAAFERAGSRYDARTEERKRKKEGLYREP